jgi:4-hydroxyproline epimerase
VSGRVFPDAIHVIDSHTEGEPTRVVVAGWPDLDAPDMAGRRAELTRAWDHLRSAVVCEPRGHDAIVGALLTPPVTPAAAAGVVFFNNTGTLGMCGHGLIGVARTLAHLGRAGSDTLVLDTPAGTVTAQLGADGAVTVRNVAARVHALDVDVAVPGIGRVRGDIAYGGNWFFLTHLDNVPLELHNVSALMHATTAIADALRDQQVRGAEGAVIDHVELIAASPDADADGVGFVLCPGGAWDRSPCGTGTSAKLAVMHARGELEPGAVWRQRSVTGGRFDAWLEERDGRLLPHLRGRAWITGEATLRFDASDPFRSGYTTAAP